MTILVLGASGATGHLVLEQLLEKGLRVRALVRSASRLPQKVREYEGIEIELGTVLDLSEEKLKSLTDNCTAVLCCLGHNMSFKGIFAPPYRLVRSSVQRVCEAIAKKPGIKPVRFVLMNTAGNSNRNIDEKLTFSEKLVISAIRVLLPPHADNESASDYLRTKFVESNSPIQWIVVRPDTLTNQEKVTPYKIHLSPTRSALFDPGKSSRINVAHFMVDLISREELWQIWQSKMPVIYNE